ncbi:Holliday junction resolvase-like protein [Bacillus sp. TS-2]|nr:Holliday junction resolvase-like protein [Bacillus sp. TS-2]
MRALGLDVGTKTIGVALSDELGWTAQGLVTLKRSEDDFDADLSSVSKLVQEHNVEVVVIGLPKNMNGTIGPSGEMCQSFADRLKQVNPEIDVKLWDERLTTVAAEKMLISADVSRKKRKKVIDKMAAVLILQGYLDYK